MQIVQRWDLWMRSMKNKVVKNKGDKNEMGNFKLSKMIPKEHLKEITKDKEGNKIGMSRIKKQ